MWLLWALKSGVGRGQEAQSTEHRLELEMLRKARKQVLSQSFQRNAILPTLILTQ